MFLTVTQDICADVSQLGDESGAATETEDV